MNEYREVERERKRFAEFSSEHLNDLLVRMNEFWKSSIHPPGQKLENSTTCLLSIPKVDDCLLGPMKQVDVVTYWQIENELMRRRLDACDEKLRETQ